MVKYIPIFIFLSFSALNIYSEDFYYNKELIYKKKFNELYKKFNGCFYTNGKKVYDLRLGCDNRHVKDANALIKCRGNNSGQIKGEVNQIIDKDTFLLQIGKSIVCVSGTDTSEMEEKAEFEGVITPSGKYSLTKGKGKKKTFRKYVQLTHLTKDGFKNYIKNRKLYYYKSIEEKVPAQTILCPKCKGKGSYLKHSKGKSSQWTKCNVCKGKGNMPGKWKMRTIWRRVDVD